jgi:hypothetical protein
VVYENTTSAAAGQLQPPTPVSSSAAIVADHLSEAHNYMNRILNGVRGVRPESGADVEPAPSSMVEAHALLASSASLLVRRLDELCSHLGV